MALKFYSLLSFITLVCFTSLSNACFLSLYEGFVTMLLRCEETCLE